MGCFRVLKRERNVRLFEKYEWLLLNQKLRLRDVPERILWDPNLCIPICVAAFRADQISRARYREDLDFVAVLAELARADQNMCLYHNLQALYERQASDFEHHPEIFKND